MVWKFGIAVKLAMEKPDFQELVDPEIGLGAPRLSYKFDRRVSP